MLDTGKERCGFDSIVFLWDIGNLGLYLLDRLFKL